MPSLLPTYRNAQTNTLSNTPQPSHFRLRLSQAGKTVVFFATVRTILFIGHISSEVGIRDLFSGQVGQHRIAQCFMYDVDDGCGYDVGDSLLIRHILDVNIVASGIVLATLYIELVLLCAMVTF